MHPKVKLRMTKLIKERFNSLINNISSKKEKIEEVQLSSNNRIVHSSGGRCDEYGYFNRMDNL